MFSGSLVAIVTPMQPDGAIDFAAWQREQGGTIACVAMGAVIAQKGL